MLFTAYGENAEKELLNVKEKIMELEQKWSVTDKNSEIWDGVISVSRMYMKNVMLNSRWIRKVKE